MTSRERVLTAINHKESDKIPLDCGAMRSTGFSAKMYYDYKTYLGKQETGEVKVYDAVQQLAIPEDWFIHQHKIDVLDLSREFAKNPEDWQEFQLPDGTPVLYPTWINFQKRGTKWVVLDKDDDVIAEMPENSFFFDQTIFPYYNDETDDFSDLAKRMQKIMWVSMTDPMWRHASDKDFYQLLERTSANMKKNTDRAIMAGFGGQLFELGCYIYRNDEFMINLMIERKRTEKMLDEITEIHCNGLKKFISAVKDSVDIIVMGDDLGTQSAPMLDPVVYRDVILPRIKKIYRVVKDHSDIKIFLHSCGAVSEFIPDFIDAGVDILNPVQTTAAGMDPVYLKKTFGRDITFWGGGLDTQILLRTGTPDQIRNEVKKNCEIFMKDGGFVFNQVHNMLPGIPPENIEAMYETVNSICY